MSKKVDQGEIQGTIGFILGLLLLLGVATCFSGCWYYDEQAYLAGYHDGQQDRNEEIIALQEQINELSDRLSVAECELWCNNQIDEVCGQ